MLDLHGHRNVFCLMTQYQMLNELKEKDFNSIHIQCILYMCHVYVKIFFGTIDVKLHIHIVLFGVNRAIFLHMVSLFSGIAVMNFGLVEEQHLLCIQASMCKSDVKFTFCKYHQWYFHM